MYSNFMLVFLISQCTALRNSFIYDKQRTGHLVRSFEMPLEKIKAAIDPPPAVRLNSFSWTDCGAASSVVHVQAISLSPDPIYLPGPLYVAANFSVSADVDTPLKLELKIWMKISGTYLEIPCVNNFGSCTYSDVCLLLQLIQSQCPDVLRKIGINCSCPVKANTYSLPKAEFDIGASVVPSGDYHVISTVTQNGAVVFCLDMYLSVG